MKWTNEDADLASAQGWGVFFSSGGADGWEGAQIERLDETELLASDKDAINLVIHNAEAGCNLARKAIAYIKQENGRLYHV